MLPQRGVELDAIILPLQLHSGTRKRKPGTLFMYSLPVMQDKTNVSMFHVVI